MTDAAERSARPEPQGAGRLPRRAFVAGSVAAVAGATAAWAFGPAARTVEVTRHDVRVRGLAAALDGLVVAHLTDLHLPANLAAVRDAHDHLRALRPDVVVLTGDVVESPAGFGPLRELLQGGAGRRATIATLGNWEHTHGAGPAIAAPAYAAMGVDLLLNESRTIAVDEGRLELRGFDDLVRGMPDLGLAEQPAAGDCAVWLTHAPGLAPLLPLGTARPALMLAGHTHGGQIRLPFVPPVLPEGSAGMAAGWFAPQGLPLYVSRGIGATNVRARFRCAAELPVFTLRRA